jgi:hypothetical protein
MQLFIWTVAEWLSGSNYYTYIQTSAIQRSHASSMTGLTRQSPSHH